MAVPGAQVDYIRPTVCSRNRRWNWRVKNHWCVNQPCPHELYEAGGVAFIRNFGLRRLFLIDGLHQSFFFSRKVTRVTIETGIHDHIQGIYYTERVNLCRQPSAPVTVDWINYSRCTTCRNFAKCATNDHHFLAPSSVFTRTAYLSLVKYAMTDIFVAILKARYRALTV